MCILVVQPRQPPAQQARGHGHDAAVDFADAALGVGGVFVFNDGAHIAVSGTLDAAVARGVGQLQREQRQTLSAACGQQRGQGVGLGQRHVAGQHQRDAVVGQQRHCLLHRVAGAQLRLLACKLQAQSASRARQLCASRFYFDSTMPRNHHRLPRR